MKLYLISQTLVEGYDTYDSAVVSAESPEDARTIHPSGFTTHIKNNEWYGTTDAGEEYKYITGKYEHTSPRWVSCSDIDQIQVEYLGETERERGVVLAFFNRG